MLPKINAFTRRNWPTLLVVIGTLIATFFNKVIMGSYGYPLNTFLFRPDDRFMDFHHFWEQCQDLNPYLSIPPTPFRPYFPFAYFFNYIFIFKSLVISQVIFFGISILGIFYYGIKTARGFANENNNLLAMILVIISSYPFIFAIDRGNPEIIILPLLLCFIYNYCFGNKLAALISLSFCISMKLTPALFILLYLKDKKYKDTFYLLALTGTISALSLFSFSIINPNTTMLDHFQRMLLNQKLFTELYGMTAEGMYFSHSFFGAIKFFLLWGKGESTSPYIEQLMPIYTAGTLLFSGLITGWVLIKKPSTQITIGLIISTMLLLPHMSADYKLLHVLIIASTWFWDETIKSRVSNIIRILIAIILVPKAYFFHNTLTEANLGVVLNPILILSLMYFLIKAQSQIRPAPPRL